MKAIGPRLHAAGCRKINLQVRATHTGVMAFCEDLGHDVEERVDMGTRLK